MVSSKILALVGLIASPTLASTPQGYGYGGESDTIVAISTLSPASTDLQPSTVETTVTDSITVTKPVTVTHTSTLTISGCGSGQMTTIEGTTSTTVTTRNTIFISVPPSSFQLSTETTMATEMTTATETITRSSVSAAGSSITSGSSMNGLATSSTTSSCDSTITTGDVDGATASSSSNPSGFPLLSFTLTRATASITGVSGTSKSTAGIAATHTSSSTAPPYPTIATSMGVPGMAHARFLMGAMSLVVLGFTMVL
ncbi:hypothetical protein F5B17DRAFT_90207 [Nemania serpens]|nr:hypothetical protein F5B17DRAFT_90207 [Nemania serpens]